MSQLPRFLLLNGPRPACHALTKLICESTLATLVTYMDLADPLHNAAASIFFDNNPLNMGLEESDFWLKPLPFTDQLAYANPLTFEQWIQLEKSRMREDFGADILGRIFHRTYEQHNWEETFPHLVIRDFDEPRDAEPLLCRYGPRSCSCVHFGSLAQNFKTGILHNIWIADAEPKKQVDQVLHELNS